MKNKFLTGSMIILGLAVFLQSYTAPTTATGSIAVKTTFEGAPMSEVLVGVSTSEENRENSVYVQEKETDSKGMVLFSAIAPGTYYLDADFSNEEGDGYYAEAEVTVATGKVDVTIVMLEDE